MNSLFRRALLFLGLLVSAVPAQAQRIDSPYRFVETSQEAGAYVAHISTAKGTLGLGSQSGIAAGVRYGIRIGGPFVIEAAVGYFPTEHAVLDTIVVDSAYRQIGTASSQLITGLASLRLNLTGPRTWNSLQPFLQFGVGGVIEADRDDDAVNAAPADARYKFGTSFAGLLGAGVAIIPAKNLAIRLDGQNLLWKVKTPAGLTRGNLGIAIPRDEWLQNVAASVGVSILF